MKFSIYAHPSHFSVYSFIMRPLIDSWKKNVEQASDENLSFIQSLKFRDVPDLQETVDELHDEVFSEINCLDCGNCCRSYTIVLTEDDVNRINTFLGKNILTFIDHSFTPDEELLIETQPCPFLGADNACSIYEARPEVCRAYPYLKGKDIRPRKYQIAQNTTVCPATYHILERLKRVV